MPEFPKFEQKIRERVVDWADTQSSQPGYGIVLEYSKAENTASVLMAQPGSDEPGQIFTNVPCPVNSGLQLSAPEPGRPCWVMFRDGTQSNPMITHFFNYEYEEFDFQRQYKVRNNTPRFLSEM